MADASMSYVYTVGGYAALFGVGYAVYHVSTQKNKKRVVPPTSAKTSKSSQLEPRKEDRKKNKRLESFTSEGRPKTTESSSWPANAPIDDVPEKEVDNREFARQLAKAQEGTKLATKGDASAQREKSVKQSRANKMGGSADKISADKTADSKVADNKAADKKPAESKPVEAPAKVEQSPTPSPEILPADSTGVSDMLEPVTRTGPSVLRVTDNGPKKQEKKPAKAPEPVESKKQRQNRKKAEAAKAARQDAETDRKGLEENQRRTARIAEGRAAKDGSQYKAANGTGSSWTQGAPNGNTPKAANADVLHQPLDTFEKPAAPAAPAAKQTKGVKSSGAWMSSLPSEEAQMEMLKDDADDWSTVKTKASKKTSKKSSSVDSGDEPSQSRPVAPAKQPAAETKKAAKPAAAQNFGAFSALTTKDESAGDDAEEEWDV